MMRCSCFYCRYFTDEARRQHRLSWPLRQFIGFIWFALPRFIYKKNWEGIRYRVIVDPATGVATLSQPKPFYGFIIVKKEGEMAPWMWWKMIKRV